MATETVSLNTREDVARFEEFFDKYLAIRTHSPIERLSLTEAFDHLQDRPDGGKIFSMLLDIHVNFLFLFLDIHSVDTTWNQLQAKGKLDNGSIFNSKTKFYGKMEIHRFHTAYVLRYRDLWEKLMGLMVALYVPDEYESFANAKSKRMRFQKLAEKHRFADPQFLKKLGELLTSFDLAFPNADAIGMDSRHDFSIVMENLDSNPQVQLSKFWNAANGFISKFGKLLGRVPVASSAKRIRASGDKNKQAAALQ